jgi:hypothetical protein
MRNITPQIPNELVRKISDKYIPRSQPIPVKTYRQLMEIIAKYSYENKDYQLYFRGQNIDYKNKASSSTIYPSIFRGENISQKQMDERANILEVLSKRLCDELRENKIIGYKDVIKRRFIQWAILQHYEVCPTPFLDISQSLRVAASFAFLSNEESNPILLVFALPYPTNRITINSEYDLIIIRLLSICPPEALRPYYQDGYLAGTDEIRFDYQEKNDLDFNRILIAKFELERDHFWGSGFTSLPKSTLYPQKDKVYSICNELKQEVVGNILQPGRLGSFIQAWTDLENNILTLARKNNQKVYSIREALELLEKSRLINQKNYQEINNLRKIRNQIIHNPNEISVDNVIKATRDILLIKDKLF